MYGEPRPQRGPPSLFYDAGKPVNRCLAKERTPLSNLSSMEVGLYYGTRAPANSLAGYDLDALAVDAHGQNLGASFADGGFHALAGVRFDQKDHAAASARSADLARQRTIAAGVVDHAIDGLRRDGGQVSLAEGPLFAHQAAGFWPVWLFQRHTHFLCNFRDAFQAFLHGALAADLRFKDFPVVDAMLARFAGVADHHAALKLVEIDAQFDAMLAAGRKFDGGGAAKGRWVMILRARGNIDDDGFGVAADVDPIHFALPRPGEAVKGRANRYGHGAGAADACACGSFRIRSQCEASLGMKKLGDFGEEREAVALGFHEGGERGKAFFALDVARDQFDAIVDDG